MTKGSEGQSEIRTCVAGIRGVSPYSASRHYVSEEGLGRGEKETADAHEKRTWMNRVHVTSIGTVAIPGMGFKLAVEKAASYLGTKIPGQGQKTWTAKLRSAVLVMDDADTGIPADEVKGEWLFVPSDGKRGGGKRVMKCFPRLEAGWEVDVAFLLTDPILAEETFENFLREAGKYIGVGRFRPENGGFYGRFEVTSFYWG